MTFSQSEKLRSVTARSVTTGKAICPLIIRRMTIRRVWATLLVAVVVSSLLSSCGSRFSVRSLRSGLTDGEAQSPHGVAADLSSGLSGSSHWSRLQEGTSESEILKKLHKRDGDVFPIYTTQIETCGFAPSSDQESRIRQLFVGFTDVQIISHFKPLWLPSEVHMSIITAILDSSPLRLLVFQWKSERCVIEQVYWIDSHPHENFYETLARPLFEEIDLLYPSHDVPQLVGEDDNG